MKIALLVPAMNLGGVEKGTYDLALGFKSRGHHPIIVSGKGYYLEKILENNIQHENLPMESKNPVSFAGMITRLKYFLSREKPDILHARSRIPAWAALFALKNSPGTHFVTSIHGFHGNKIYSRIMAKGERVITVSESLRKYAVEILGASPEITRVVHNGFDLNPFLGLRRAQEGPMSERIIIGTVGRLTESRCYPELIRAIYLIKKEYPNLELHIVGDGPGKSELLGICRKLGLEKTVFLKKGAQVDYLPLFDIFVAPFNRPERIQESVFWPGRSAVEAQAAGIPTIVTADGIGAGGFKEGNNCLFVPPRDPGAIAESIRYLLKNPSKRQLLVRNAQNHVKKFFSLDTMVDQTLSVYREMVKNPAD